MTKVPLIPLNIRVPINIKRDFHTICRINCTTMTSEFVRFMNTFISSENKRFRSYKIESKEINELKRSKLDKPKVYKNWEKSYENH